MSREKWPDRMNVKHAAAFLGVAERTLQLWRTRGTGPAYYRITDTILYLKEDLEAFMASCRIDPGKKKTQESGVSWVF